MAGVGTEAEYLAYAEDQHRALLGPPGRTAFRATCPGAEGIGSFDLVLLHRPAAIPAAAAALEAIEARLADGRLQPVGQVTLAAWRDDARRRQVAVEEEARRREAFVATVRADALAGRLDGWAAVGLKNSRSDATCVVADTDPRWGTVLSENVLQEARGFLRRVQADADADGQFARLLSGGCGLLVARGRNFGDVLRGLEANRREGAVLPLRIEAATVLRALAPVEQTAPVFTPQVAAPPQRAPTVLDDAVPIGIERSTFARGRLPSCNAAETFAALGDAFAQHVAARLVNFRLLDLENVREIQAAQADRRGCSATAVLNSGREQITYTISPSRMQAGTFLVEVGD